MTFQKLNYSKSTIQGIELRNDQISQMMNNLENKVIIISFKNLCLDESICNKHNFWLYFILQLAYINGIKDELGLRKKQEEDIPMTK